MEEVPVYAKFLNEMTFNPVVVIEIIRCKQQ